MHAPKTIGYLLGLVPMYLASTILLTKSVLKISRGNHLGRGQKVDSRTQLLNPEQGVSSPSLKESMLDTYFSFPVKLVIILGNISI